MWSFLSRLTRLESTCVPRAAPAPRGGGRGPPSPPEPSLSRRALLLVLLAVAGAAVAFAAVRLGRPPPTDEDLVRALFEGAARAAEERRVGDAVAGVSARFRGHGLDRDGVKRLVAFHVLRGEWVSVSIAGARVAVEGDRARATVDAVLARGSGKGKALGALLPGEASAHRFACVLHREADGWRVVEAEWRPVSLADALAGPAEPGAAVR